MTSLTPYPPSVRSFVPAVRAFPAFFALPALLFLLAVLLLAGGCAVMTGSPAPQPLGLTMGPVRAALEHGDWVVIREAKGTGNFIGTVTNMPFSHSGIYDAENDKMIEADASGVHFSTLAHFLEKASRVWVVKPVWATPERRPAAVERARARVGRPYDYLGLLGLPVPDAYYCSELVIDAWRPFIGGLGANPIPPVISPGRLHHWGRVAYDSLELGLGADGPPGDGPPGDAPRGDGPPGDVFGAGLPPE